MILNRKQAERILEQRYNEENHLQFKIKWKGKDEEDATWLPYNEIKEKWCHLITTFINNTYKPTLEMDMNILDNKYKHHSFNITMPIHASLPPINIYSNHTPHTEAGHAHTFDIGHSDANIYIGNETLAMPNNNNNNVNIFMPPLDPLISSNPLPLLSHFSTCTTPHMHSSEMSATPVHSNNYFQNVDFQQIKANGAPYGCPFCDALSFAVWADWKQHWYQLHNSKYFDDAQKMKNSHFKPDICTDSSPLKQSLQSDKRKKRKRRKRRPRHIANKSSDTDHAAKRQKLNTLSRCKICDANTTNNAGLSNHIRARHNLQTLRDYHNLTDHKIKECQKQNEANSSLSLSATHKSRDIKYKYKCTACANTDRSFFCAGHIGLTSHLRSHVKRGDLSDKQRRKLLKQSMRNPVPITAQTKSNDIDALQRKRFVMPPLKLSYYYKHNGGISQLGMESLLYDEWTKQQQLMERVRAKQSMHINEQELDTNNNESETETESIDDDEDMDLDGNDTRATDENRVRCCKDGLIFSVVGDGETIMDEIKRNIIIRVKQIFGDDIDENDVLILDNKKNRCIYMYRSINKMVELRNMNKNDILLHVQERKEILCKLPDSTIYKVAVFEDDPCFALKVKAREFNKEYSFTEIDLYYKGVLIECDWSAAAKWSDYKDIFKENMLIDIKYNRKHCGEELMPIFLKNLTGQTLPFVVSQSYFIEDLKCLIFEWNGIPIELQVLVYEGKPLENGKTFREYAINRDSTIYLKTHTT